MRKRDLNRFEKALNEMRKQVVDNARKAVSGDVHLDPDDFPDEIDTASSESGLSFIGRLRERERVLLQKIDEALERIQDGAYGVCIACGEEIGLKRLQARPVATLCIDCKSQQEKLEGRS